MNRHLLSSFAAAAALAGSLMTPAYADEQIVYWPLVTDGAEYRRVSYPHEAGSLLALAGAELVLEVRRAGVTYWPITRQYITEAAQGKPVEGTIELVDGSGKLVDTKPETFVLWSPAGVGAGVTQLVRGDAAKKLYQDYVTKARAAQAREQEYQRIVAQHQAAAEAWIKLAATRRPESMPPPPPELTLKEPEPYRAYASEPREAPVLTLAEGDYTVRIRDSAGSIIPGSERTLIAFGPLAQSVGYVLRPEDRWTQASVSFSPRDAIYTTGRTDLFFQPVPVVEYASRYFTRLFDPQSYETIAPGASLWVPLPDAGQISPNVTLDVWNGRTQQQSVPRRGYRVQQQPGFTVGYTIEEFTSATGSSLQPDFQAMRLDQTTPRTYVGLAQGANSEGGRSVVTVPVPPYWLIFLPAFIPLIAGFFLRRLGRGGEGRLFARKRKTAAQARTTNMGTEAAANAAQGRT
jgi:hypothetical protein